MYMIKKLKIANINMFCTFHLVLLCATARADKGPLADLWSKILAHKTNDLKLYTCG